MDNQATTPVLYGIPNCDSVKKARRWLEQNNQPYTFVDLRKEGISAHQLSQAIDQCGLESIVNKRSSTWKQLSDLEKGRALQPATAVPCLLDNPTLIKRPLLVNNRQAHVGFSEVLYAPLFN